MLFALIIILFSAIIHEYMHGWAADRLGDPTAKDAGRLTLNPLAHIDLWGSILMPALIYFGTGGALIFGYAKPVPFNPYNLRDQKYGAAKVAVAGPLANLITALFFGLILRLGVGGGGILPSLLAVIVQINLMLMVFNLVPIPPLDGSKVVMPFLPANWQMKYLELERYGMILVLLFVMFGFSLVIPVINFLFKLIVGT
ncbi:site-2 protease family protein [Candidatus Falkowbacteria bacterium]|nr:site-2 protease family protein [Candidatus Falkowbacteria bacterium]